MATNRTVNPTFVGMTNENDIAGPPGTTVGGVKTPQQKRPKMIPDPNASAAGAPYGANPHVDPAQEGFKGGPSGTFNGTAP